MHKLTKHKQWHIIRRDYLLEIKNINFKISKIIKRKESYKRLYIIQLYLHKIPEQTKL